MKVLFWVYFEQWNHLIAKIISSNQLSNYYMKSVKQIGSPKLFSQEGVGFENLPTDQAHKMLLHLKISHSSFETKYIFKKKSIDR